MTLVSRNTIEAVWLEPAAASVVLALALFVNRSVEWPWMWVIDLLACAGAALSYRRPVLGATLTGLSLAVWLPFENPLVSASGLAFYINIFAAARKDPSAKIPVVFGLTGLAYLTLIRKAVEIPADRWTSSIMLLIGLILAYGGGLAFRYSSQRIEGERETGDRRLQDLQVSLARELHDSVAQTLSTAAMRANIALSDPEISPLTRDQMERIAEECRSSAHDLRQLLSSLREEPGRAVATGALADVESLRRVVEAQAERLRVEGFSVDVDVQLVKLSAARSQTLAAITVEVVNNMIKHAKPHSCCTLSIVADGDDVLGVFTNVMRSSRVIRQGFGLTGIQERLTLLDGTCQVVRHGGHWTLRARLPLGVEGNSSVSSTGQADLTFMRPVG